MARSGRDQQISKIFKADMKKNTIQIIIVIEEHMMETTTITEEESMRTMTMMTMMMITITEEEDSLRTYSTLINSSTNYKYI